MSEDEKAQLCGLAIQRYSDIRKELACIQEKRFRWNGRLQAICLLVRGTDNDNRIQDGYHALRQEHALPTKEEILTLLERETALKTELADVVKQLQDMGVNGLAP